MRLKALDGMRGVVALGVALFHVTIMNSLYGGPFLAGFYPIIEFFFVTSGFVMAMIYGDTVTNKSTFNEYVVRRMSRVWPLHLAILGLMVALEFCTWVFLREGLSGGPAFSEPNTVVAIFTNALLVQSWGVEKVMSWNFPSWTASVEIVAYILMGLMCLIFADRRVRILCAALLAVGGAVAYCHQTGGWTSNGVSIARCMLGFFSGYILFYIWKERPIRSRILGTAAEIVSIAGAIFILSVGEYGGGVLYPVLFGLIVLSVYALASGRGLISKALSIQPLTWLGERSFSIYMIHVMVIAGFMIAARLIRKLTDVETLELVERTHHPELVINFGGPMAMNLLTIAYLVVVVIAAKWIFDTVENPARIYFNKLANAKYGKRSRPKATENSVRG